MGETENPQQRKEKIRSEIIKDGVEKIEIKDGVCIFHFTAPIQQSENGTKLKSPGMSANFGTFGMRIADFLGIKSCAFRSVDAGPDFCRLQQVVKTGIDMPNYDTEQARLVDLTIDLEKALEFGIRYEMAHDYKQNGPLTNNRMVMVYESWGGQVRHLVDEGGGYKHKFLKTPREALRAILLLYGKENEGKGLVKIQ